MKNPIIVALDVPSVEQALALAQKVAPAVGAFKIGFELFTSAGPDNGADLGWRRRTHLARLPQRRLDEHHTGRERP